MIRKHLRRYALGIAVALALLIASIPLPGLIGALLAFGAAALALGALFAMIREDRRYGKVGNPLGFRVRQCRTATAQSDGLRRGTLDEDGRDGKPANG